MSYPSSVGEVRNDASEIRSIIGRSSTNGELNLARRRTRSFIRAGTAKHLDSSIRKATRSEGKSLQKEISQRAKSVSR